MRTLVDIPQQNLNRLTKLSQKRNISRSQLIREYVEQGLSRESGSGLRSLFGIWKDRNVDAMDYLDELRKEWDREF